MLLAYLDYFLKNILAKGFFLFNTVLSIIINA